MIPIKARVLTAQGERGVLRQTAIIEGVKRAIVEVGDRKLTMPYADLSLDEQATYGDEQTTAGKQRPRGGREAD